MAIYIDGGVHIHAIETQEQFFIRQAPDVYVSSIPNYASGKRTSRGSRLVVCMEVALDGPVMWHIEPPPMAVIVVRQRERSRVCQRKSPVTVQRYALTCAN